jgi:predicted ATPase
LLLFSVLYGLWAGNYLAFKGDVLREAAAQFLALAKKQGGTTPLMIGHRLTGVSLLHAGDIAEARVHLDRSLPLYDAGEHRPLAMRFGQDVRVAILFYRAFALWVLGYPEAAVADCDRALREAQEIGQAATLMPTLALTSLTHIHCGNYTKASELLDTTVALANEKGASFWKAGGMALQGCVWALTGKAEEAVDQMTSALNAWRATGATLWIPVYLSYLTRAYAETGRFDDAWRCIDEALVAVRATKETWYEAVIYRVAGEIALMSPAPDKRKAEAYFDRALAVARKQRAKSWELRAAMSLARLWRDQGMRDEARGLLAPVYAWFTEGFDTLDLQQAKMLLEELESQQPADA